MNRLREALPRDAREVRTAAGLLRERGWVLALLGVVVLSVVFTLLGRWQYHRHEDKVERRDRVTANYDAAPVPLAQLLADPGASLPAARQWHPVVATGRYLPEQTVLVRNRPLDGQYGYEVLVPLRLDDGGVLVVDRGWVPGGQTGQAPDAVPAPPTGTVQVVARLRPSEPGLDRPPPAGQQLRIDLPRVAAQLGQGYGASMYRAYGVLVSEQPAAATGLEPLPRPDVGLGINLAYAVQWWAFAVTAYLVLAHYLVREARRRSGAPAPSPAPRRPAARERDEEYEDRLQA